jgi:predicted enzyme related to lactoylglutathione lyase
VDIAIGNICIDTNDLPAALAFWQSVTGYEISTSGDTTYLTDPHERGLGLSLQTVPEPRIGKNRLHLDLFTDNLEGEAARVRALGAIEVQRFTGDGWIVMADPDGNQFCICGERAPSRTARERPQPAPRGAETPAEKRHNGQTP